MVWSVFCRMWYIISVTSEKPIIVSKSDILGPIAYFSDIEKVVSFERAMFEDYNFKYRTKIFLLFMSISPL